jgi:hypothetical protein
MPFVLLKPQDQSFIVISREIKRLRAIVLCEGKYDIETINSLIDKLGLVVNGAVGITDCEGCDNLEEFASLVATLARARKTLEKIVVILDADNRVVTDRIGALTQSLRSQNVGIEDPQPVSGSIYQAKQDGLNFLMKIVGKMDMSFERHEMEDYAVQLLVISHRIEEKQLNGFHKSSDFIEDYGKRADKIIQEAQRPDVEQAYENVLNLLQMV